MNALRGVRRIAAVSAAAMGLLLGAVPPALAYTDHFYTGNLYSSYGFASYAAHSINYIQGNTSSNDLICVGIGQGAVGGFYDPYFGQCQASGYGAVNAYYSPSCCWHGEVENGGPLNPTYINYATHYSF